MAIYLGNFTTKKSVFAEFSHNRYHIKFENGSANTLEPELYDWYNNAKILLAWYYTDNDGSAFVLLERDGKLYEVNGSHCSCYGLEGQFEPEKTSIKALEHRETYGTYFNMYGTELKKVLKRWKKK